MRKSFQKNKHIAKVKNKLIRVLSPPVPEKVKRVNLAITYACNSRCRMCNIWKKYKEDPNYIKNELTFDELKRTFENSKYLEFIDEIVLTGGEPFLRSDLSKIVGYFSSKYPDAAIIIPTNGMHTEHILTRLKDILTLTVMPPTIVFSIDGMGGIHDRVRGVPGSYLKTIQTIRKIKVLDSTIKLGLSLTITRDNYKELEAVYTLSRELNVAFTMRFAATSENYYENTQKEYLWTSDELSHLEGVIKFITRDIVMNRNYFTGRLNPDTYFFSKLIEYQRDQKRMFQCFSGTHSFFLDPYGNVFPCMFLDKNLGNIKEDSFDAIWMSSMAKDSRVFIEENNCHCWSECEVLPSLQRQLYKTIFYK